MNSAVVLDDNRERQLDELEALSASYEEELVIRTPGLVDCLRAMRDCTPPAPEGGGLAPHCALTTNSTIGLSLWLPVDACAGVPARVRLDIVFPANYPDQQVCATKVVEVRAGGATTTPVEGGGGRGGGGRGGVTEVTLRREHSEAFNAELAAHLEAESSGFECAFAAIGFVCEHASRFLTVGKEGGEGTSCTASAGGGGATATETSRAFYTFNHLLCGKEHKKEAEMAKLGSKACVSGAIVYGTPGLLILEGDADDIKEYLDDCRGAGKRGTCTLLERVEEGGEGGEGNVGHFGKGKAEGKAEGLNSGNGGKGRKGALLALSGMAAAKALVVGEMGYSEDAFKVIIGIA